MRTYRSIKLNNIEIIIDKIYKEIFNAGIPTRSDVYYLDFVNTIFPNSGVTNDRFRNIPELMEQMVLLGLEPHWLGSTIILMHGEVDHPIHRDSIDFGYALNIPVLNTKGTYTIWYDSSVPAQETRVNGDSNVTYWHYNDDTCAEIDRVELLQPAILNIDTPHRVVLENSIPPRITLSLRLGRKFNPDSVNYN